jgi:hypothetical protein
VDQSFGGSACSGRRSHAPREQRPRIVLGSFRFPQRVSRTPTEWGAALRLYDDAIHASRSTWIGPRQPRRDAVLRTERRKGDCAPKDRSKRASRPARSSRRSLLTHSPGEPSTRKTTVRAGPCCKKWRRDSCRSSDPRRAAMIVGERSTHRCRPTDRRPRQGARLRPC